MTDGRRMKSVEVNFCTVFCIFFILPSHDILDRDFSILYLRDIFQNEKIENLRVTNNSVQEMYYNVRAHYAIYL